MDAIDAEQTERVLSYLARLRHHRDQGEMDLLESLRPTWLGMDAWDIVLEDLETQRYKERGRAVRLPSPHDYFDAALASCKALTAIWYAKRRGIPLERVATRVERDDHAEREGQYRLRVHLDFQGPLTDEQHALLRRAADNCPIHKLMTRAEITIETAG